MKRGLSLALVAMGLGGAMAPAALGAAQAARCAPPRDPVVGTWHALDFTASYGDWTDFTLRIERVPGSTRKLRGTVIAEIWHGGPDQSRPGSCELGSHYIVEMDASGSIDDGRVTFDARSPRIVRTFCGETDPDYNADHFFGVLRGDTLHVDHADGERDDEPAIDFKRDTCVIASS